MNGTAKKHLVDSLAEWTGALVFAGGLAFAAYRLVDAKLAALVAASAFAVAFGLLSRIGQGEPDAASFDPAVMEFDPVDASPAAHETADAPASMAWAPTGDDEELLLDDPLIAAGDSRVVRLFAGEQHSPAALIARIEDYLDRDEGPRPQAREEARREEPVPDASAALHAALANIRASLR